VLQGRPAGGRGEKGEGGGHERDGGNQGSNDFHTKKKENERGRGGKNRGVGDDVFHKRFSASKKMGRKGGGGWKKCFLWEGAAFLKSSDVKREKRGERKKEKEGGGGDVFRFRAFGRVTRRKGRGEKLWIPILRRVRVPHQDESPNEKGRRKKENGRKKRKGI